MNQDYTHWDFVEEMEAAATWSLTMSANSPITELSLFSSGQDDIWGKGGKVWDEQGCLLISNESALNLG